MGRTSLLTDTQWHEITRRLLQFESCRALGREFGISEAAIRKRCSERNKEIRIVANMLLEADKAFKALPMAAQVAVYKRVAELKRIAQTRLNDGQALVAKREVATQVATGKAVTKQPVTILVTTV